MAGIGNGQKIKVLDMLADIEIACVIMTTAIKASKVIKKILEFFSVFFFQLKKIFSNIFWL